MLGRAEMTRRIAHGERYLLTRVFLSDGRVMQQTNRGLPDLENAWREVGHFTDLQMALGELEQEGWTIVRT